LTNIENTTGSFATTGSNTFYGTQVFSGSVFIATDLIVQGSSSIQYISASSVSIGTNIVQLNTATPSVRFAGMSVQDSGSSAGITGSMLWDSLCNRWIYSNPSTIGYSGGMLLSGPRASTLGSETTLTCNYIAKSGGGDHLYDSCIIDDGTTVCVNATLKASGQICSLMGNFGCIGIGTTIPPTKLSVKDGTDTVLQYSATGADGYLGIGNEAGSVGAAGKSFNLLAGTQFTFLTSGAERMRICSNGFTSFACELTAKTLGTNDLILNNLNYECANYVDGTRGSWLIQEGENDLFIINQISCKKYKFNLTEIK
jgi:hypothetical protein